MLQSYMKLFPNKTIYAIFCFIEKQINLNHGIIKIKIPGHLKT